MAFEPNVGQTGGADFVARGKGFGLSLGSTGASLALEDATRGGSAIGLTLLGANPAAAAQGQDKLAGVTNYLLGNDPAQWHTNVPTYGRVVYAGVYAGVDLAYHGETGQLEYDFIVQPGATPGTIRLAVSGASSVRLNAAGDLVLRTNGGDVIQKAPQLYQDLGGTRRDVAGRFVLQDGGAVGFAVGAYDHTRPLTIDPVLNYSTYLGGTQEDDGHGFAIDASGYMYLGGETYSSDFPILNAFQATHTSAISVIDAYVAKLSPAGALVYATYLGGNDDDRGLALGVDGQGDAYLTGDTLSTDFPTTPGAWQTQHGANAAANDDAFLTKLGPTGGMIFSTFLGAEGEDTGESIAVDAAGNAYVGGFTQSTAFPILGGIQSQSDATAGSAFVTKFNSGGAIVYSTYFGAGGDVLGIALDSAGAAYLTGNAGSSIPLAHAIQSAQGGAGDAFVAKLDPSGGSLSYSTYLGGAQNDVGMGIALDSGNNAYVVGTTRSNDFPTAANPFQATEHGSALNSNMFVTKLTSAGQLSYSTYLGGSSSDQGMAIAVDGSGDAFVTGDVQATDFPTTANALQTAQAGGGDAVVAELNPTGSGLLFSTYFGGSQADYAEGIAVDAGGAVYLGGTTFSSDLPLARPIQAQGDTSLGNAFIAKITPYTWQAADVAVGSDNKARVLWSTANGAGDIWSVQGSSTPTAGPTYGPVAGWTAVATAAGGDGLTRVLWASQGGAAALWLVDAAGTLQQQAVFGPIAGWTAQDVAVGSDNLTRVLWVSSGGAAAVWNVNSSLQITASNVYGPFAGWAPRALAAGSPDGLTRLLWTSANGAASLWLLQAGGTFQSAGTFGPVTGWLAQDIAVGADNQARLLWTRANGKALVWAVNNAFAVTAGPAYGPYAGWHAARLSGGSDGLIRLLWANLNGAASLWLLTASDTYQSAGYFGPF